MKKDEEFQTIPLWSSATMVRAGYAVLDCGAAKSLCGATPIAQGTETIDESYHFRGIGNQIVSSFLKLRVSGSIDGKEVSFTSSVTPG